jgi:Double zinc ribbon
MKCASCGVELKPDHWFCGECGAKCGPLIERRCPSCGAINRPENRFCTICGKSLELPGRDPDGYKPRWRSVTLNELIGWPGEKVIATLGQPEQRSRGQYWRSSDGRCITTDAFGKVHETVVYGPIPGAIPPFTPYEQWSYRHVPDPPHGTLTWILYLTRTASGDSETSVVAQVVQYPTGVLF